MAVPLICITSPRSWNVLSHGKRVNTGRGYLILIEIYWRLDMLCHRSVLPGGRPEDRIARSTIECVAPPLSSTLRPLLSRRPASPPTGRSRESCGFRRSERSAYCSRALLTLHRRCPGRAREAALSPAAAGRHLNRVSREIGRIHAVQTEPPGTPVSAGCTAGTPQI